MGQWWLRAKSNEIVSTTPPSSVDKRSNTWLLRYFTRLRTLSETTKANFTSSLEICAHYLLSPVCYIKLSPVQKAFQQTYKSTTKKLGNVSVQKLHVLKAGSYRDRDGHGGGSGQRRSLATRTDPETLSTYALHRSHELRFVFHCTLLAAKFLVFRQ